MAADPIRKPTVMDVSLLVGLAAIWGSAFMGMKLSVPETGPVWLVALRASIGFLALLPWALWRGWVWPSGARDWMIVAGLTTLNVVLPFLLLSWATQYLPSSTAALLMGAGPLLGLVVAHISSTDDRMNIWKFVAVGLGFAGISLVLGAAAFAGLRSALLPQAACVLASACYVTSGILVRNAPAIPPTRLSALVLGVAAVIVTPTALITQGALPPLSADAWMAALYLGLVPTGVAYILRYYLVRKVGLSFFSHVGNMIPLFGVFFGVVLLGERLTPSVAAAALLIIAGLFVARAGSRANKQPVSAAAPRTG
ncbi:MAG: DMT family transporter [Pseudomonadota bacterium]